MNFFDLHRTDIVFSRSLSAIRGRRARVPHIQEPGAAGLPVGRSAAVRGAALHFRLARVELTGTRVCVRVSY